ncbi:response regulator transcription factor [Clostridium botulinum]|uniref:Response regulator n=1 Tax=Clostridium botulinum (strain 657 / Type Ba4) TaxID=515621 RepID=A0A3F2ZR54_CLOB6|nr:LuxR C-terminal-related transcriptional regulator [Clostridium botulinum]ACQ51283.1 putative response regulator [Clostridium botulinum Ba4 str. 657]AJE13214.1 bacterial regulatory s, luxR family protein [Clostridium botulinum CDC_1436]EDT84098.1 putative response regulator [Clostridium botulinum Bf]MBY6881601.1 response regulator transcription factor [Clostridium botulinum]NEZ86229.1 response regulator transcription factor [Clostridium botulinum]
MKALSALIYYSSSVCDIDIPIFLIENSNITVQGCYLNEEELRNSLITSKPELILILKSFEDTTDKFNNLIKAVTENLPSIFVMFINITSDRKYVLSNISACISKDLNEDNFKFIIKCIIENLMLWEGKENIFDDYSNLLDKITFNKVLDKFNLTDTEKEILNLKKSGLTRKEIASRRVVSDETIRNHITNILKKLQANSTKEALCKVNTMVDVILN